jgi:hypothetical protein
MEEGLQGGQAAALQGQGHFVTMVHNQSGFSVERGKVTLSHFHNDVPLEFKIPVKFEFERAYQVTVSRTSENFRLSIVYEEEDPRIRKTACIRRLISVWTR